MMSRRTFDRRFHGVADVSPLQWLLYQRVLISQRLLEESELSIDYIARRAGFRNGVALRRHFRRQVGTSPLHYRMKFPPHSAVPSHMPVPTAT
jgi:transcriptional regulator GlxA family with amidase domain